MITITFKQLMDSYPNLKKVSELNYLVETRYRMAKALMLVEQERAHYEKQYGDLLSKYGEQTGIANWSIKKENLTAFTAEVRQLQSIEVSLPIERLLHTNVEAHIEAPADIVALSWLIHFPELDREIEKPFDESAVKEQPSVN
jgi:hypothetical protein